MGGGKGICRRGQTRVQRSKVWGRRLGDWRKSGLSIAAYCRRHAIAENVFHYWKHKEQGLAGGKGVDGVNQARPRQRDQGAFIAVKWPGLGKASPGFELETAKGRLRIPMGFEEASLRRLLAVLEDEACG